MANFLNRITTRARGATTTTGIMASAAGTQPADAASFRKQRTHSIFASPLRLNTRLQSGRVSLTAEPNSAPVRRHVGTQTGIHMVTTAPQYPLPSPMMLGQTQAGGAGSSFGTPTIRAQVTQPGMAMIPIMQRKNIAAGRAILSRAGNR